MATRRIKEITNTATTFASDDFIALDGTTQGTRKMDKDDLIAEVSAGVSGDYLEEANNLSDVASLDTSKLNMEIPDVGTAPNEVPLSGQLGTMAFQDADGVSVAELQVESTTGTATTQALTVTDGTDDKFVVQESGKLTATSAVDAQTADFVSSNGRASVVVQSAGASNSSYVSLKSGANEIAFLDGRYDSSFLRVATNKSDAYIAFETGSQNEAVRIDSSQRVGVNQSSPGSFYNGANNLVIGDHSGGDEGMSIASGSSNLGRIYFSDGLTGTELYRGSIYYDHSTDTMGFGTSGSPRWSIGAGGVLLGATGNGIRFDTGTTLDDYEEGTWTPVFISGTGSFTTMSMSINNARYTKIGNIVHVRAYFGTSNVDATGASGALRISGLPFTASGHFSSISVGYAINWAAAPIAGYVRSGTNQIGLTQRNTSITGSISESFVTGLTTGAVGSGNVIMIDGAYETNA